VRISEIDLLRGLVSVLMALDHVRDYMLGGAGMVGVGSNLLDPTTTTPALYITRWITHLCADIRFSRWRFGLSRFAKVKTTPDLAIPFDARPFGSSSWKRQ
jgi:hypothetical protein